jgi:hypothetical protein
MFPTIRPNLATFSPWMGATGHRTDSVDLKDLTMFRRMALTSSSGLRTNGGWSCLKANSKTYAERTKTHK